MPPPTMTHVERRHRRTRPADHRPRRGRAPRAVDEQSATCSATRSGAATSRTRARPCAACTSMSNRISVWSQTKPIGTTRNRRAVGRRARRSACSGPGPIHGSGVRPALWYARRRTGAMPARSRHAARGRGDFVRVPIAAPRSTRAGRLCAVNMTSLARRAARGAHALGERLQQQRDARGTTRPPRTARRRAAPRVAASMYFCTLSVENCGAIGMPMTRVDAGRRQLGERVLDERLPVAHADGDRHRPVRAARAAPPPAPR